MQGYLWIIWVKLAGALRIIGGEIMQLINILFCGYRRLEIHYPLSEIRDKCMPKPILAWAQVPQRVTSVH
jgi:hypothetical protein